MTCVAQHGDDLSVIGVIYQTGEDAARDFQERYGDGGWPELTDPGGRTALDLGVTGPPETFFVDADGIVRYRHIGPLTTDVLREQLAALGIAAVRRWLLLLAGLGLAGAGRRCGVDAAAACAGADPR